MFKVIHSFIDGVEKRNYKPGDAFIIGPKTDAKRLAQLSGYDNNIGRPLIEHVDEAAPTSETPPLDQHTVDELKEIATAQGLAFKNRITKSELIALIKGE